MESDVSLNISHTSFKMCLAKYTPSPYNRFKYPQYTILASDRRHMGSI